jgi:hypothetical protein
MTQEEQQLEFVSGWRRAERALKVIRFQELREFRHEDRVGEIDALLDLGARHAKPRATSGFVEQQRLFRKARQ